MITETKIIPRYAETDQMGIVHHSVYAIWYEFARTEHFNKIGIRYDELEKSGLMTPIVKLTCDYKRPAYYNQEVTVKTRVTESTPVKFVVEYKVYDKNENLLNVGTTTLTWTDRETFKIINLKKTNPELYDKIEKIVES